MFKGPLKPAELCEYTLAPPVKAASDRKTGHIRPFVVRLPPVYFHTELQTPYSTDVAVQYRRNSNS